MVIEAGFGACQHYVTIAWLLLLKMGWTDFLPNVGTLAFGDEAVVLPGVGGMVASHTVRADASNGSWLMYDGGPGSLLNHDFHAVLVLRSGEFVDLTARHFPAYAAGCTDPVTGTRLRWRLPDPPKYLWLDNPTARPSWYVFRANPDTTREFLEATVAGKADWVRLAEVAELHWRSLA